MDGLNGSKATTMGAESPLQAPIKPPPRRRETPKKGDLKDKHPEKKPIKSSACSPVPPLPNLLRAAALFSLIVQAGRVKTDLPTVNPVGREHPCDRFPFEGRHWTTSAYLVFDESIPAEDAEACVRQLSITAESPIPCLTDRGQSACDQFFKDRLFQYVDTMVSRQELVKRDALKNLAAFFSAILGSILHGDAPTKEHVLGLIEKEIQEREKDLAASSPKKEMLTFFLEGLKYTREMVAKINIGIPILIKKEIKRLYKEIADINAKIDPKAVSNRMDRELDPKAPRIVLPNNAMKAAQFFNKTQANHGRHGATHFKNPHR